MSGSIALAHRGLTVSVRCPSRPMLDWLDAFLRPPFEEVSSPAGSVVDVELDPEQLLRHLRSGRPTGAELECFTQDQAHVRLPVWIDGDGRAALFDERARLFLARQGSGAWVLAEGDRRRARATLMRVVRELATAHALACGDLHLHAAAVASDAGVTLLVGRKGAGKTTFLLHALAQPGIRFVANDRVLVGLEGGVPVARGMPTIVRLRPGTVEFFPGLAERMRDRRFHLYPDEDRALPSMSPAQLRALVGVSALSHGRVARIVLLELADGVRSFALARVSHDEAVTRLARDGLLAGGTAAAYFGCPRAPAGSFRARLRELVSHVPCYVLGLGPLAYRPPTSWAAVAAAPAAAVA